MAVEAAAPGRRLPLVRSVPVWAWLAGLVVVSVAVRYLLARRLVAPWIMVDELTYSDLAKSFAATGHFLLRGHSTGAYGVVYPALLSPAWAFFSRVPQAYAAAKAINSVAMSLAAVPAYFLARRVLSRPLALVAAVLTVAAPLTLYAGMLMTENAFYPIFLLTALATVWWLEEPTWRRTLLVLAAVLLAFLTRAQALALAPALLCAPFLVAGRKALREYRYLYGFSAVAAVLVVVVQAARGASPLGLLGAYEVASHSSYTAEGVAKWLVYHWGDLILAMGVLPFAALVLLLFQSRGRPRTERAFLAATVSLSFWLVLEVAAFASVNSLRIEERNLAYVAPLFFVALLLWIERGAPRPPLPSLGAGGLAVGLVAAVPFASLIGLPAISDTPAILPLWSLVTNGVGLGQIRLLVILAAAGVVVLMLVLPRRFLLALPALVLLYFAVSQSPNDGKYREASAGSLFAGITQAHPDWIDRAVGADARVAVIWSGNTDRYSIWENEFFNRSLRDFYFTQAPLSGDLPETALAVDRQSGYMRDPAGRIVHASYVLTDGSVALAGSVIRSDARKGMLLYRVNGLLRQLSRVAGLYPQDTWSGPEVTYTRLACDGGSVTAELASDPALFTRPQTVTALVAGRIAGRASVAPAAIVDLKVPVRPASGLCVVRYTVSPTAVPAQVTHGTNPDPRVLGIHFNRFTYRP